METVTMREMAEGFAGLSPDGSTAAPDTPVSSDIGSGSVASCNGGGHAGARRGCRVAAAHGVRAVQAEHQPFRSQTDVEAERAKDAVLDSKERWLAGLTRTSAVRGRVGGTTPPAPVDHAKGPGTRLSSGHEDAGNEGGRNSYGGVRQAPRGGSSAWARSSARNLHEPARRSATSPGRGQPISQRVASPSPGASPSRGASPGRQSPGRSAASAGGATRPRVGAPYSLREQFESLGQQKVLLEWQVEEATRNQHSLEQALSEERQRSAADRDKLAMLAARIDQLENGVQVRGSSVVAGAGPVDLHVAPPQPAAVRQGSLSPDSRLRHENDRLRRDLELSREMLARYTEELACIMPNVQRMLTEAKSGVVPPAPPTLGGQRLLGARAAPVSVSAEAARASPGGDPRVGGQATASRRGSSPPASGAARASPTRATGATRAAAAATRRPSPGGGGRQPTQPPADGSLSKGGGKGRPAAAKPSAPTRSGPNGSQARATSPWGSHSATSLGMGEAVAARASGRFA